MPAPAFRLSSSSNASGTNFVINKPSGVVDGDLLIVAFNTFDNAGNKTHTPPAGWTLIRSQYQASGTNMRASVYRKIAASEPSSWTFIKNNDGGANHPGIISCVAISNPGNSVTPLADEDGQLTASGTSVAAPSVDAGSANDLLVFIIAGREPNATTDFVPVPPTGYTEHLDDYETGAFLHLYTASKPSGSSGPSGTVTATVVVGGYASLAFLLAIKGIVVVTPVADFTGTPLAGTHPLSVAFTDTSTNTPTSWLWNFGDGATSTAQNPSHNYTVPGVYTVSLTATNAGGSNTKTRTAYVTTAEPAPVADFSGTPLTGATPLAVTFTDLSTNMN